MSIHKKLLPALAATLLAAAAAQALPFTFSTGDPNGLMAMAANISTTPGLDIETADDFVLEHHTVVDSATFTGLMSATSSLADIQQVTVAIYEIFPRDSVNPPSGNVPTRVNSPADNDFVQRDSADGSLTFSAAQLGDFSVANSVAIGINPLPNVTTDGEGPLTGQEVMLGVNFVTPLALDAGHYFFVPQVLMGDGSVFYWLSGQRPLVSPFGTPITPDLQTWIRNGNLAPDWLRVGTDVVGPSNGNPAPTFNAAFTLNGTAVIPEPSTLLLIGSGLALYAAKRRRQLGN